MKASVYHATYGEITYNENFFTGKKTLNVNGVEAKRERGDIYTLNNTEVRLKGSFLSGVTLLISVDEIEIVERPKWYEYLICVLTFLFVAVWGNSPTLCSIVPIVGGALGGAIAGLCSVLSLVLMRRTKIVEFKILIGLGMFALTVLSCFFVAFAIIILSVV